jgi:hypothetical protein
MSKRISAFLGVTNVEPEDYFNLVRDSTNYKVPFSVVVDSFEVPEDVTRQGNEFNGVSQLAQTEPSGKLPVSILPDTITNQGNVFNGNSQLVQTESDGKLPAIDGSQLTNLPGGGVTPLEINIQSGTSYTVQASDLGKVIVFDGDSGVDKTLTIPSGLGVGFYFEALLDIGFNTKLSFVSSGVSLFTAGSFLTETKTRYAVVRFIAYKNNTFTLISDNLETPPS